MKKLYSYIKTHMLISHYKMIFVMVLVMVLISCVATIYSNCMYITCFCFAFSLLTFIRLFTYKVGKIPLIMIDTMWLRLISKLDQEEAERIYKEKSIHKATIYFMLTVISFFAWIICEIVVFAF